jgi:dihydrofolate reductase (trimethoprim resistance protein)
MDRQTREANARLIALMKNNLPDLLECVTAVEGAHRKFQIGDAVRKTKGSQWSGKVVGWYSTELTPEGYAVESSSEHGSVQIYPAAALEKLK